jgi:DNA-binding YbaB/EbfC family protein
MFGGLGNFASILKNAQAMQQRMGEMKENLGRLRVEGSAGGGLVTVEATGHLQIVRVRIDPTVEVDGDREMLEDLILSATNQALQKAQDAAREEMGKLTGGLDVPGMQEALSRLGLGGVPGDGN